MWKPPEAPNVRLDIERFASRENLASKKPDQITSPLDVAPQNPPPTPSGTLELRDNPLVLASRGPLGLPHFPKGQIEIIPQLASDPLLDRY